ncbi:hypothetical protein [Phytohabitans maris]|uniref:HNH endonuclease n=1 Tax=Phytohabitans maris TaxID=3071409 RepID=UPI003204C479
MHHIRKLADLNRHDRPAWVRLLVKRRRKTIVICRTRHEDIHAGPLATSDLPDAVWTLARPPMSDVIEMQGEQRHDGPTAQIRLA